MTVVPQVFFPFDRGIAVTQQLISAAEKPGSPDVLEALGSWPMPLLTNEMRIHYDDEHGRENNRHSREADLGAEFVSHPCLAFGDAIDLRLVQGIDFVAALWSLLQQAADQPEGVQNPLAPGALRDFLQVPVQIAAHPADIALELA